MDGKTPCNCHQAASLPPHHEMHAALQVAMAGQPAAFGIESIANPPALVAAPPGVMPAGGDLQTLIAIARAHPGLRITLSFGAE